VNEKEHLEKGLEEEEKKILFQCPLDFPFCGKKAMVTGSFLYRQWEFAINLSGADLPLRDVDDLAWALADFRGHNFFAFHGFGKNNY
jgi:hypothetical protein